MWLFEWFPAGLAFALVIAGLTGLTVAHRASKAPFGSIQSYLVSVVSTMAVMFGCWVVGGKYATAAWRDQVQQAQELAKRKEEQSAAFNAKLKAELAQKDQLLKENQHERTQYITKTVTKYDSRCVVPNAAVRVLHSAAENTVSPSPSSTDGDPSDVKLSEIVQNTADNYTTCYQIRDKLIAWQNWYTEQKQIYESTK